MWRRKLQFSASLLPLGGGATSSPPPPFSNTRKNYPPFISHSSTHNSFFNELNQKRFDFFSWGFKNYRFQLNLLSAQSFCSDSGKSKCWKCNGAAFLFCEACRSVQPIDQSVDYFQILGLEKKYDIEEGSLEGKYKDWQKKLHPDLVHTKSQEEREYAAEQSSRVTAAYRTLSDPIARAIYIMKLEGVDVDEEEGISDPELLSEIMEIRESVEEARDTQTLNRIQEQIC
ncbi:hypothetical protein Leryth_000991 [Lithospermum erythrorhizon]|nr:hypothetical protein Leryth_000991 [Lithospermum erythrorhizon]